MPSPAQGNAPVLPVSDLTNVKVKVTGVDTTSSGNRLDASTLDRLRHALLVCPGPHVDGLPDSGAGAVGGVTTTITCSFLTASAPTAGETYTIDGGEFRCTEAEVEYAVGELVKGTATFVSVPAGS
jgi:hypothetical protein